MTRSIRAAIIGASGYTGAELVRFLHAHPLVEITTLVADRRAGEAMEAVYPHLRVAALPPLVKLGEVDWQQIDVAFCALPHATTQQVVKSMPDHVVVIDLSADFRLRDVATYEAWYGSHQAPELQYRAVYGLTEHYRAEIAHADLIACPGCYPTASLLPLLPLLKAKAIVAEGIIIDAKSGVTGAGRAAKEATLFAEVADGIHPYGVGHHRHMPEIEQEMSVAYEKEITVSFTPHLMPMNRGILATIYVQLAGGQEPASLRRLLHEAYRDTPFVHLLPEGVMPATRQVRGSNHCLIGVAEDRLPGQVILLSAIDNLVKGASGQAVQNMNLRFGFDEAEGLGQLALFP